MADDRSRDDETTEEAPESAPSEEQSKPARGRWFESMMAGIEKEGEKDSALGEAGRSKPSSIELEPAGGPVARIATPAGAHALELQALNLLELEEPGAAEAEQEIDDHDQGATAEQPGALADFLELEQAAAARDADFTEPKTGVWAKGGPEFLAPDQLEEPEVVVPEQPTVDWVQEPPTSIRRAPPPSHEVASASDASMPEIEIETADWAQAPDTKAEASAAPATADLDDRADGTISEPPRDGFLEQPTPAAEESTEAAPAGARPIEELPTASDDDEVRIELRDDEVIIEPADEDLTVEPAPVRGRPPIPPPPPSHHLDAAPREQPREPAAAEDRPPEPGASPPADEPSLAAASTEAEAPVIAPTPAPASESLEVEPAEAEPRSPTATRLKAVDVAAGGEAAEPAVGGDGDETALHDEGAEAPVHGEAVEAAVHDEAAEPAPEAAAASAESPEGTSQPEAEVAAGAPPAAAAESSGAGEPDRPAAPTEVVPETQAPETAEAVKLPTMEIEPLVETPPPSPEEVAPEPPPDVIEQARASALEDEPHQLEAALTRELDADPDRKRKALIQYEIGHLLQTRLDSEGRAVKAFAHALNLDPLLRPNVWAIRRIFVGRKLWPNLLKLQDAEVRFEEDPTRKAEVLLEKGWIQQDQLKDTAAATESFWAAHAGRPQWLAPLLALEKVALAAGDLSLLAEVCRKMVHATEDPGRRTALLIELARLEEKRAGGTPQQALQILEEAYAVGDDRGGVLEQMEQIALAAGLHRELTGVLRREGDELLRRPEPDRRLAAAKLRLAAQIARDALEDGALAQSLLSAALEALPDEPMLQSELLELCEDREDWMLAARLIERRLEQTSGQLARANLYHRLGLARQAADDPAASDAFERAQQEVPGFLPVLVAEERPLLAAGDLAGLARLWTAEAEAVERMSPGLPMSGRADPAWCASALWRAASVLQRLDRADEAIALCRRALAASPGFEPARDDLVHLLRRAGQHAQLAALLEEQLVDGPAEDREAVLESLLPLYAGPLGSPDRQLDTVRRLLAIRAGDRRLLRAQTRLLQQLGRHQELEEALRALESSETEDALLGSWKLARARLLEGPLSRPADAITLYHEVLDRQPDHAFAFAGLEALLRRLQRHQELATLLRQAADQCSETEEGRARRLQLLRSLAVVLGRQLQQPTEALAVHVEIVAMQPADRVALRELEEAAAAAGDAARRAETLEAMIQHAGSDAERSRLLIRLAEILDDQLSDPLRAEELLTRAVQAAPQPSAVVDAIDSLARRRLTRGDSADALRTLEQLQQLVPADAGRAILEERAWISAGPAAEGERAVQLWSEILENEPGNRRALLARVRLAARDRNPTALAELDAQLAGLSQDPAATLALELRAGTLADAGGEPLAGAEAYGRALKQSPGALEAICGLLARPDLGLDERADLLRELAAVAPDRVREDMRLHRAEVCERAGRFREAQAELQPLLEKDPDHLPALLLLQRLAEACGNHEQEARCWARIGHLLSEAETKAEAFTKAAALQLALSRAEEAINLYRHALALRPRDQAAYDKLRELYRERDDSRGLDELLGHRIRHADDVGSRIIMHMERAELRLQRLSDRAGGVRELLCVLRLEPRHLEALRQLARLYDEDGNAVRALDLYKRYLDLVETVAIRRPAVLRMAELFTALNRTAEAVEVCRSFLEQSPEDEKVLESLAELYIKVRDFPHAVTILERLGQLRPDREWRARHLRRVGMLYWKDIKDLGEARSTLMRARDLDPCNLEIVGALRQICRQLDGAEDLRRVLERAKDDLRESIATQPCSVELYRQLMQVAEWDEDTYTLLAALGALCTLGAADSESRELYQRRVAKISFEPKRQVAAKAWRDTLLDPAAKNAYGDVWAQIAEVIPRLFPGRVAEDPAQLGVGRSGKVDRKAGGPVSTALDRMAAAAGILDYDIFITSSDPEFIGGLASERPAIVVGHSVVTSLTPARRFHLGRLFSLLRERAVGLAALSRDELELILAAAVFTIEPGASFSLPRSQVELEARRMGKALSRRARKALPLAVTRLLQEGGDLDAWREAVITTADRSGLLICGDVLIAVDEIVPELRGARIGQQSAEIVELLKEHPQAGHVLAFSVGRDYLNLRRELQL